MLLPVHLTGRPPRHRRHQHCQRGIRRHRFEVAHSECLPRSHDPVISRSPEVSHLLIKSAPYHTCHHPMRPRSMRTRICGCNGGVKASRVSEDIDGVEVVFARRRPAIRH